MVFQKGHLLLSGAGGNPPKGKIAFERSSKGEKLHRTDAILAYCYDCMGFYEDGRMDCNCPKCPLYPWMPYKGKV